MAMNDVQQVDRHLGLGLERAQPSDQGVFGIVKSTHGAPWLAIDAAATVRFSRKWLGEAPITRLNARLKEASES